MLERAAPIVERYRVPLAVENHKDQRIDERVALYEHVDSEFVGACVDTGNSFALLDGAYESIEALAPFAFTVHLKDQALREYENGFLLGDIPLGQGSFDLKRMVASIRKAQPKVRFALELITRDPLKCAMPDRRFLLDDAVLACCGTRPHHAICARAPGKVSAASEQPAAREASAA